MAAKKADKEKLKKKRWMPIVSPELFGDEPIGETLVAAQEDMIGKPLVCNLMNLANEVRKQNINVKFKIVSVKDNRAVADIIGYQVTPSSIKRLVRRRHKRLDDSERFATRDGFIVRIKSLMITRTPASRRVGSDLKRAARKFIATQARDKPYIELAYSIISGALQDEMKRNLGKIFPLKVCDIKSFDLIPGQKAEPLPPAEPKAEPEKAQMNDASSEDSNI